MMRQATKSNRKPQRGLLGLALLWALLWTPASNAHQQKTAVTRLLFNENSGNLEVMHRLFLHDAEHAASVVFGEKQDLIESADSRALLGSYVVNRFAVQATLADGSTHEVSLDYVGEEIDGQFLWVYQEAVGFAEATTAQQLDLINSILRDVWPEQSNLVNLERDGRIRSVTFTQGSDTHSLSLTNP